MIYKLLVILNVLVAAGAQLLLKKGASKEWGSFVRQYLNGWVIGGYGIMVLAMMANIYAVSKGVLIKEVSIIESLSYLFVPTMSFLLFKEKLSWRKYIAIGIIMCGVVVFFV